MNKKINIFDLQIDSLTMKETVVTVSSWIEEQQYKGHYVVTPNVDHIVNLANNKIFKAAYEHAALVVADGKPLVLASRLLNMSLPETVPGSDLVPAIFDYYQQDLNKPLRVFLLGAMPGVAERAALNIQSQWSNVNVVGSYSPDFGFEKSVEKSKQICQIVSQLKPDIVVFGVGAPKQEIWSNHYADQLNTNAVLCVGATIDFLAGEKSRAPVWMRKVGLEWLHRALSEPKRLLKRYIVGAFTFPMIVLRELYKKGTS